MFLRMCGHLLSRGGCFAALCLLFAPLLPAQDAPPVIQAFFGPKAADDPAGLYFNLMRFLDTAKVSIHASIHEVDMISIAEKLAERASQGLDVQIVIEAKWWTLSKNKAVRGVLEKSKVKVILDTKSSGLMHNKFFVVDGKRVWTGSTNITETCLLYNPNNSLWIEDAQVAENYMQEFNQEHAGHFAAQRPGGAGVLHPTVQTAAGKIRTMFCPEDKPLGTIAKLIDGAQKSVDILCFVFSSQEIAEAAIRAHRRGVKVRVLLDNVFSSPAATSHWKYVPFRAMSEAGIACKYDDENSKLHHKLIIIDNSILEVGSMNFSLNGEKTNSENVLIIESPELAQKYEAEFERLWKYFDGNPSETTPDAEGEDG